MTLDNAKTKSARWISRWKGSVPINAVPVSAPYTFNGNYDTLLTPTGNTLLIDTSTGIGAVRLNWPLDYSPIQGNQNFDATVPTFVRLFRRHITVAAKWSITVNNSRMYAGAPSTTQPGLNLCLIWCYDRDDVTNSASGEYNCTTTFSELSRCDTRSELQGALDRLSSACTPRTGFKWINLTGDRPFVKATVKGFMPFRKSLHDFARHDYMWSTETNAANPGGKGTLTVYPPENGIKLWFLLKLVNNMPSENADPVYDAASYPDFGFWVHVKAKTYNKSWWPSYQFLENAAEVFT